MGTGAFSTASVEDRSLTAEVAGDESAMVSLVPGADSDISTNSDGALKLDLSGDDGEGVNIDSVYTWGDHDNPASDHAFKITNQDNSTYNDVTFSYDVENDGWIQRHDWNKGEESILKFTVYASGAMTDMVAPNHALMTMNPVSRNITGPHSWLQFAPGDEWYVVVDIDTTGPYASTEDDLSGDLTIEVSNRD